MFWVYKYIYIYVYIYNPELRATCSTRQLVAVSYSAA